MMDSTIVIQARMGSRRYPGKALAPLSGRPLIEHVILAAQRANPKRIVLATADSHDCYLLRYVAEEMKIGFYAGNADDVLDRFYTCVSASDDPVIRLTGDCPLVDHRLMQQMVEAFSSMNAPYFGITNSPDGNDIEVMRFAALQEAHQLASDSFDREHVTPYLKRLPKAVARKWPEGEEDVKYSVDTVDDLEVCNALINYEGEGARWQDYVRAYRSLYGNDAG